MQYKPDWEKVRKRYEAFWHGEIVDRALFYIVAPKTGRKAIPVPENPVIRFTDSDYLLEAGLANLEGTFWGADSIPVLAGTRGSSYPAFLLGAKASYGTTLWVEHVYESLEAPEASFEMDFNIPVLRKDEEHFRRICQAAEGKCFVRPPESLQGLDSLSHILGPEQLCLELAEPKVKLIRCLQRLDTACAILYERFRDIALECGVDTTGFLPLWSPGRYGVLQCDFMVMIGKEHFIKYGIPSLRSFASWLDHCLFHLDGVEATHHLDSLLECPEIDGIQWQPGNDWDGPAKLEPWFPMLRKIQQAGKKIYVTCEGRQVETVMRELSSKGLFLTSSANSEDEAIVLEKTVRKLTHD